MPTKSVFSRDEPVVVTLKVKNVSGSIVQTYEKFAPSRGLEVSQNGRQIGPESYGGDGGTDASMPQLNTYSPGQSRTADVYWYQLDVSRTPVGPGTYTLIVWYQPLEINGISISPDAAKAHIASQPVTVTIQ